MSRDFALVVMVMPCGLTPVEGIDFVDWFYFSCMHVPMCGLHKHTYTQTNVQYGAFEEWSLLTEPQHQPVKNICHPRKKRPFVCIQRMTLKKGRCTFYNSEVGLQDAEAFISSRLDSQRQIVRREGFL